MDILLSRTLDLISNKHGASKELANFLGIHPSVITDWKAERNKSYTKYAPQIAEYYGVSLDWLSGLSNEKEQKEKPDTISSAGLSEIDIKFMELLPLIPEDVKLTLVSQLEGIIAARKK